ncbi:unnamed protein product, partial [Mesorhabditis spiculigera]
MRAPKQEPFSENDDNAENQTLPHFPMASTTSNDHARLLCRIKTEPVNDDLEPLQKRMRLSGGTNPNFSNFGVCAADGPTTSGRNFWSPLAEAEDNFEDGDALNLDSSQFDSKDEQIAQLSQLCESKDVMIKSLLEQMQHMQQANDEKVRALDWEIEQLKRRLHGPVQDIAISRPAMKKPKEEPPDILGKKKEIGPKGAAPHSEISQLPSLNELPIATVRSQRGKPRYYDSAGYEYCIGKTNSHGDTFFRTLQRTTEATGMKEWPAEVDVTLLDAPFLRKDNCAQFPAPDSEAFKLFYTDYGRKLLETEKVWSFDGTVVSAPEGFQQVLVIGVQKAHLTIPAAFAFVTTEEAVSYRKVFEELYQLPGISAPDYIMSDLVKNLRSGYQEAFEHPVTHFMYCGFHYIQLIISKIQKCGLSELLCDPGLELYVRGLLLLAFIQPSDAIRYFEELRDEAFTKVPHNFHPSLIELYNFYAEHFIGSADPDDPALRTAPIYKIEEWNLHERVCHDWHLGISTLEGFNVRLKPLAKPASAHRVAMELLKLAKRYEEKELQAQQLSLNHSGAFSVISLL